MTDFIKISNSNLQCPNCKREFPIKNNVALSLNRRGTAKCKAYGVCPHCGHEGCANRESYELELTPNR